MKDDEVSQSGMHHFIWRRPYCHLKNIHSESLIHWTIPPLFTEVAFVWLDEGSPCVYNNVTGSGNNAKMNASWHLKINLICHIGKYKSIVTVCLHSGLPTHQLWQMCFKIFSAVSSNTAIFMCNHQSFLFPWCGWVDRNVEAGEGQLPAETAV